MLQLTLHTRLFHRLTNILQTHVRQSCMQNNDILQDIKDEELPKLKDLFKKNWPRYLEHYIAIENFIKWKKLDPNTKIQVMCPEGRWDDGTYVFLGTEGLHHMFLYTMENSCERLVRALKETKRIDWKEGPLLYGCRERISNALMPVFASIGQPILASIESVLWFLPRDKESNIEIKCPANCYVAPLSLDHANEINNSWSLRSNGTDQYIRNVLKMNGGIGLFGRKHGELRATAMTTDIGCIGMLRIAPEYRNMGYGTFIAQAIMKHRAQETTPTGYTFAKNHVMQEILSTVGMTPHHMCRIIQFKRTAK